MLTMYNLMLVSVESVWERFYSPTDSKTTKICVAFLIILYNRDSNTNGPLLRFIIGASSLASWSHCTQIDLSRKVLRVVQNR